MLRNTYILLYATLQHRHTSEYSQRFYSDTLVQCCKAVQPRHNTEMMNVTTISATLLTCCTALAIRNTSIRYTALARCQLMNYHGDGDWTLPQCLIVIQTQQFHYCNCKVMQCSDLIDWHLWSTTTSKLIIWHMNTLLHYT